MDKTEVKPTWSLAWGLFWRQFLISLGIYAIIMLIMFLAGVFTLLPLLGGYW